MPANLFVFSSAHILIFICLYSECVAGFVGCCLPSSHPLQLYTPIFLSFSNQRCEQALLKRGFHDTLNSKKSAVFVTLTAVLFCAAEVIFIVSVGVSGGTGVTAD